MRPHPLLEKSIYYDRKASVAWYCNHKIKEKIYRWLSKYYEEKWRKIALK